jgi:hypothetical protein
VNKSWDNTTLGTLRIEGSRLVVDVNSARRRKRIEKEIARRLGTGEGAASDPPPEPSPELDALTAELRRRLGLGTTPV